MLAHTRSLLRGVVTVSTLTAVLTIWAAGARAAHVYWNVAGPDDWNVGANWDLGYVPGATDPLDRTYVGNGGEAYIDSDVYDIDFLYVQNSSSLEMYSGADLSVTTNGHITSTSQLTIKDGASLLVSGQFRVGDNSLGTLYLQGGTLDAGYTMVGARTNGQIIQTGGTAKYDTSYGRYIGWKYGLGVGTYEISGGVFDADRAVGTAGICVSYHAGDGTFRVVGSEATITVDKYDCSGISYGGNTGSVLLEAVVDNGGISTITVNGTADLRGDFDVELHGGVAMTTGTTFDVLTATSLLNNGLTPATEPLWEVNVDTVLDKLWIQMDGSGQSLNAPYDYSFNEVEINGGDGYAADFVTINNIDTDKSLWVLLDVEHSSTGLDLTSGELSGVAAEIAAGGHNVWTLDGQTILPGYDLAISFDPTAGTSYFAWDAADFTTVDDLVVTRMAAGIVPEPSTLVLLALGLAGLFLRRWRRR